MLDSVGENKMRRFGRICVVALLGTGCLKTYVERSATLGPEAPLPTLMVHTGVTASQSSHGEVSSTAELLALASDVIQNTQLDEFGETVLDASTPFLETQGVQLVIDADRAKSTRKVDWGEVGNSLTFATGGWTDARGGVMSLVPRMLFRKAVFSKMGTELHQGGAPEGYLYVVGTVHERGLFFPFPKLALTFVVHDQTGQELLLAQGVGQGERSFFLVDRSPQNLGIALEQALTELDAAVPTGL